MIHTDTIEKYPGSLQELAAELGDLKYDALAEFLGHLSAKIQLDGDKDAGRRRHKLAHELHDCAKQLAGAQSSIERAWDICEPFMK